MACLPHKERIHVCTAPLLSLMRAQTSKGYVSPEADAW